MFQVNNDNNVVGIFFNNGMQGIAKLSRNQDERDFYSVEHLLRIVPVQTGENQHSFTFDSVSPFCDLEGKGESTNIPKNSCFLYNLTSQLIDPFINFIGGIQIADASNLK